MRRAGSQVSRSTPSPSYSAWIERRRGGLAGFAGDAGPAAVAARWLAVEAGERAGEGIFRAVADLAGHGSDGLVGVAEPPRGEVQPPPGEVGERRFANQEGEPPGEGRPGHGDLGGL